MSAGHSAEGAEGVAIERVTGVAAWLSAAAQVQDGKPVSIMMAVPLTQPLSPQGLAIHKYVIQSSGLQTGACPVELIAELRRRHPLRGLLDGSHSEYVW